MPKIDILGVMERKGSAYPEPYRQRAKSRLKRRLGDAAGLTDFGVNLVRLPPGEWSSQRHWHSHEDEFIYVLDGALTMITDEGEQVLHPGDCAAFPKGDPNGHHFINRGDGMATYLEVGSRHDADVVEYPDIDMRAVGDAYQRKDGTPL